MSARRTDELYHLIHDPARSHHLLQACDPTRDQTHVTAFRHAWGRGRVFYLALGHDRAVFANPSFQQVGRPAPGALSYRPAASRRMPSPYWRRTPSASWGLPAWWIISTE